MSKVTHSLPHSLTHSLTSTVYCAQMTGEITPKWGFVSTAHTTPTRGDERGVEGVSGLGGVEGVSGLGGQGLG